MKHKFVLILFLLLISCEKEKLNFDSFEIIYKHGWVRNYSILINNPDSILIEIRHILPKEHRDYLNESGFYKIKFDDTLKNFIYKNLIVQKEIESPLIPPDGPLISFKMFKNKKEMYLKNSREYLLLNYFEKQIDSLYLEKTNWKHEFHNPTSILPIK